MHTKPMAESDGTFNEWKLSDDPCKYCGVVGQCYWRTWESSDGGYDDENYECRACDKVWWVEGADA